MGITIFKRIKLNPARWLGYLILMLITAIVFIPILIAAFSAFKTPIEIGSDFPLKPPSRFYLENLKMVFAKGNLLLGFRNSIFLVGASVLINALLGSMTVYCLARFEFKLKKAIWGLFLLGMVIPIYVTEIGRFSMIRNLGAYNTIFAPIIIYAATDLMQIYIFLQYIEKIPVSLDESAMLDGCSYFGIFWRIIFPLLLPATATLAIIKAVEVINDMYIPYLYMPGSSLRTLTTTLMYFSSSMYGAWHYLSAAILVVMIPTLAIYLFFQKYIFAGIIAGAIKE
ncbi:MAG TPA: carbohydrate ABC transporter permease [Bacillota bacterium]|nr:carbohydrate ABC transporter permease [Bacillota bacterium]